MAAENLPYVNMSIAGFCRNSKELLKQDDADFAKFVATGIYNGQQAVVDPILDSISESESFLGLRDYDSLLGIHDTIAISTALTVYPVAKKEDTLQKTIHVSSHFTSSKGGFDAPVHKIPNLCIGKWGTHNIIRVLIPDLYHDQRSQFLSQDEQRIFYEHGLRPAVERIMGDRSSEWPATYDDEMFRARGRNGQLSFQTKVIPQWSVHDLGPYIRESLAAHGSTWGTGLVFLHQIRGVKHSTSHAMNVIAAQEALEAFMNENDLDLGTLETSGEWWIDVGVEISSAEGQCLAWRTDSHFHLVKCISELPDDTAYRITSLGSSKYTRDPVSHLPAVSGCRIAPGPRARGTFDIQYIQLYTTDKSHTFRQDQGHHGKFVTCTDVLKGKAANYLDSLYHLYRNAIDTSCSLARVEVRVPLRHATEVLHHLNDELLRRSLLSIHPEVWWGLRSYRALGFKYLLEWQEQGPVDHRVRVMGTFRVGRE